MRRRCCFPRTRLKQVELWSAVHRLIAHNHAERMLEYEDLMARWAEWRKRFPRPEAEGGRRLVVNLRTGELTEES